MQTRIAIQTYQLDVEVVSVGEEFSAHTTKLGPLRGEALRALGLIAEALDEAGAVHWITYGTLLGFVREGHVLDNDSDLDIAVLSDTVTPEAVVAAVEARGLILREQQRGPRGVMLQKFDLGPVRTDIAFLGERDGELVDEWSAYKHSVVRGRHRPTHRAVKRRFDGIDLLVPENPEAYLEVLFGRDWRVPITHWVPIQSPPNCVLCLDWRDLARHIVKVVYSGYLSRSRLLRRARDAYRQFRAN